MKQIALTATILALSTAASAATTTTLLFKSTDNAARTLNSYTGWGTPGGVNENVTGATDLENNGIDYRNAAIDTDWATYETIRVAMYAGGEEKAYIEFDATGTTAADFFAKANVISSSWTDLTATATYNYFSTPGDTRFNRHWFVNGNYGGCGRDAGHFIALDGQAGVCGWENTRSGAGSETTAFLYADASTKQNWTTGTIGIADTLAISASYSSANVPLPAAGWLLMGAVAGLGALRRSRG